MKWFRRISLALLLLLVLSMLGGAIWLWWRAGQLANAILVPHNPAFTHTERIPTKIQGLELTHFEFSGADAQPIAAVLVSKSPHEDSSRQLALAGELTRDPAMRESLDRLKKIDFVLISVEWDYGIQSAVALAQSLTAIGLKCVLWEPRGKNQVRSYSSHGLRESSDVPLLINSLALRLGRQPICLGIGQGFGASMMIHAAAKDKRLAGIVSIDAYSSLRSSIRRGMPEGKFSLAMLWLMDRHFSKNAGYECFEVASVDHVSRIHHQTPLLLINLQTSPQAVAQLSDALILYNQSSSDEKQVMTLRLASDPPKAKTRSCALRRIESADKPGADKAKTLDVHLLKNEHEAMLAIVTWLDAVLIPAIEAPRINMPASPNIEARKDILR